MKVIVVRHGTTDYNVSERLQGVKDIPLNDVGRKDAIFLGETLGEENIDIIYTSPLVRAKETSLLLHLPCPIYEEERLIERNLGTLEGLPISCYNVEKYNSYQQKERIDQVETLSEVYQRLDSFFQDLKKKSYQTVVLVSHGGVIKIIKDYFEGLPEDGLCKRKSIKNCEMIQFQL